MKKHTLIILVAAALLTIGGVVYLLLQPTTVQYELAPTTPESEPIDIVDEETGTNTDPVTQTDGSVRQMTNGTTEIGKSTQGNPITAHHFGSGDTTLLFVGGLHGGYSYNTTLVAYELIDYLTANPNAIPQNLRVTVVPVANPDGLAVTVGTTGRFTASAITVSEATRTAGRFTANRVDLNRNFDCEWQASGTWRTETVSGGSAPTSEPEAMALVDLVTELNPAAAIVWFGAEGRVYPSACNTTPSRAAITLASTFANAANYPIGQEFDAYPVTGDFVNWLAKEGVPAISVLLTDHSNPEWVKNQAGITAVFSQFAQQ